jgi:predicted RNase H-like nuclease
MAVSGRHRGAPLPYKMLAGVVPCPGGWLVAPGRLQGIQLFPVAPEVFPTIREVLDYKPAFQVVAVGAPIGLPSESRRGGRTCDREARRLLGWPRSGAMPSPPTRAALKGRTFAEAYRLNDGLSAVTWGQLPRIAELDAEMEPYWQRNVYEVHPELSFYQLNDDAPMRFSKHSEVGRKERRTLLEDKVKGVDHVLDRRVRGARRAHLIDAAACLWTARRIAARAVARVPEVPEWDDEGLRMEILR